MLLLKFYRLKDFSFYGFDLEPLDTNWFKMMLKPLDISIGMLYMIPRRIGFGKLAR